MLGYLGCDIALETHRAMNRTGLYLVCFLPGIIKPLIRDLEHRNTVDSSPEEGTSKEEFMLSLAVG